MSEKEPDSAGKKERKSKADVSSPDGGEASPHNEKRAERHSRGEEPTPKTPESATRDAEVEGFSVEASRRVAALHRSASRASIRIAPQHVAAHVKRGSATVDLSGPAPAILSGPKQPPPWLDPRIVAAEEQSKSRLLRNNALWVAEQKARDPTFFSRRAHGQQPDYLFIGCSDSRVPAEMLLSLEPGELFVHRNIANLVVGTDVNFMSVLQYAVEVLRVKHIIVCGHYGCGGVRASMERQNLGLIENWLRNIRDVQRLHQRELMAIPDFHSRFERLVELNVAEQCINLYKTSFVQESRMATGWPSIHGFVYQTSEGLMRPLPVKLRPLLREIKDIYSLTPNTDHDSIDTNEADDDPIVAEAAAQFNAFSAHSAAAHAAAHAAAAMQSKASHAPHGTPSAPITPSETTTETVG